MIQNYIENANFEDTGFAYTLSLISGKHKMVILYCLMEFETVRFNELKRYLKTISDKTLSMNLKELEADYFGIESGNKVADKFARSGLTASKAETVDAPVINEFPICLECRFIEYQNNEYGCGVIGKVVNVTADESVMVDGEIDMFKVNAIAFDPYTHGYYKVTERVGEAFRDGLKLKK